MRDPGSAAISPRNSESVASNPDARTILDTMRDVLDQVHRLPTPNYQRSERGSSGYIDVLRNLTETTFAVNAAVGVLLNSATQINSLPPEVLSCIFSAYATDEPRYGPASFRTFQIPVARDAARLTQVCKHWRDVALSTPSLWAGVVCGVQGEHTPYKRYIRLSRSSALRVKVCGDAESTAELFRDQPSRIRHLLMMDVHDNWTRRRDPQDLLAVVGPDLLSCTLDLRLWPRGPSPDHSISLFSGEAKDMRELVIHQAKIVPLDSFPRLTHLMLYDIQGTPSLPHILQLLHRCPKLEEVCIRSSRQVASLPTQRQQTVTLQHLRRISILTQSSFWLVSHIDVPATCLVRLDNVTHHELSILTQLPACHRLAADRLTRLGVFSRSASPIIQGWTTEFNVELSNPESNSGLFLNIAAPHSTSRAELSEALTAAFTGNPLFSNVAVLWAVRQPTSFVLVPSVLRALPAVTMLGMFFHDRTRIADLGAVLAAKAGDPIMCPRLSALCVQNCAAKDDFESVRRIVESRAQAQSGLRLRRLAIGCADSLHARALDLQEHVDDLIVRPRLDMLPPKEWRDDPEIPDKGIWPDWDYFQNPDHSR
ncbi:hypothetical protein L226DRAFT_92901 [Lentinus tigrinus ALCF2SS1-7]|uniref:F-box domain-containing protein n=1 Tax=Lentinus tigrinus ALCF2SS1-6 TaxID=1328759 RepID=A0A5C2RYH8_9APHY|nr:hypothetical protein L227DRAFT_286902 [Lentinus tigrinus ALCF2SS1-6]RPD74017.1 hypothetical protein L226DRAFT_92901 [Lentinus tigrinus ALCF2SS1-7]